MVAVNVEAHIHHHMAHLRAGPGFPVRGAELAQRRVAGVLAERRAFENAVFGEAVDPVLELTSIDVERVARVELANLLAVFSASRYDRHRLLLPRARRAARAFRQITPDSLSRATSSQL